MFPHALFPNAVFPNPVFPGSGAPVVVVSAASVPVRDRTVLKALAALLRATGEFSEVTTHGPPEDVGASSESLKLAGLELAAWQESILGSDTSTTPLQRDVKYVLWIHVRDPDPDVRDDELDRLAQVASNAVDGVTVLGATFAPLTFLRSGVYQEGEGVERRLRVLGEFSYEVPDYHAHNATP